MAIALPKSITVYDVQVKDQFLPSKAIDFTSPSYTAKTNTFMPGGALGEIEIPNGSIEPLVYNFSFIEHLDSIYKLIGDSLQAKYIDIAFRGVESNGVEKNSYVIQIQGFIKSVTPSAIARNTDNTIACELTAHVVAIRKNNQEILKLNIPDGSIFIDGAQVNLDDKALLGFS
jgi:phage tail tube protein FII